MNTDNHVFTQEMKSTHTLLIPTMLPIHFKIIEKILISEGYKTKLLQTKGRSIVDEGIKNVHNDTCYPALLVIGQMIDALKSGNYDPDKTALLITQTGGGCRASNYIFLLKKALNQSGFPNVPVISLNFSSIDKNAGFKFTFRLIIKIMFSLIYGDMIMWLSNQCKPYEKKLGDTQEVEDKWVKIISKQFNSPAFLKSGKNYSNIIKDFSDISRNHTKKIKVGIVGEIYMKYSPLGNNSLEKFLIEEGAEPIVSGVLDFILYCLKNNIVDYDLYKRSIKNKYFAKTALVYLERWQNRMIDAIERHGEFRAPCKFEHMAALSEGFISKGAKMGEGWLLTAEMVELVHSGVNNVVCTQPFGCLPNHIVAKGMMGKIKEKYSDANIVAIDYDPSATAINQENRLKLMLANAKLTKKFFGMENSEEIQTIEEKETNRIKVQ